MPGEHQSTILLRKEWKQVDSRDIAVPTARPCEVPLGPTQQTTVISADVCTKYNNSSYIQSHCAPVILGPHKISLIKVSVALYRQEKLTVYLGSVRCHFPLCHMNSWMENKTQWMWIHSKMLFSYHFSGNYLVCRERRERNSRKDGKYFFLVDTIHKARFYCP